MADEKRYIKVDMCSVKEVFERIHKAKYCIDECSVPVKNAFLGCIHRPVKYMEECPRLKQYLKKEAKRETSR